jgi:UDP-hydrolysing UDP-N-acetyl-D-glucosamine 2-epimerase
MAGAYERLAPDILVLLGDRFEMLAAAQAAMVARLPIAHIHGGEATEGAMDEAFRHAITKMAHLHFVSTGEYRARVIQLGEAPGRVFDVGAPGLDYVFNLRLLGRSELEKSIGFALGEGFLLVTYHPVTLGGGDPARAVEELVSALDSFPDHKIIVTGANADPGHDSIAGAWNDYATSNPDRVSLHASLGQRRYLSAMKHAAAVVGNSSSGIIEAPAMKVPTVNLGARQRGRVRAASVIDCDETAEAIAEAIARALSGEFAKSVEAAANPYGTGGASGRILDTLKGADLSDILMKRFHDIPVPA